MQVSRTFTSRKSALAALKSRCSNLTNGSTSGTWAFATLWVSGDTLHASSNYHSKETLELLIEKGAKAATKTLPSA